MKIKVVKLDNDSPAEDNCGVCGTYMKILAPEVYYVSGTNKPVCEKCLSDEYVEVERAESLMIKLITKEIRQLRESIELLEKIQAEAKTSASFSGLHKTVAKLVTKKGLEREITYMVSDIYSKCVNIVTNFDSNNQAQNDEQHSSDTGIKVLH